LNNAAPPAFQQQEEQVTTISLERFKHLMILNDNNVSFQDWQKPFKNWQNEWKLEHRQLEHPISRSEIKQEIETLQIPSKTPQLFGAQLWTEMKTPRNLREYHIQITALWAIQPRLLVENYISVACGHLPSDPITVVQGEHRLTAAFFLGMSTIRAHCSGSCDNIARFAAAAPESRLF
jgi:hypothetical protein